MKYHALSNHCWGGLKIRVHMKPFQVKFQLRYGVLCPSDPLIGLPLKFDSVFLPFLVLLGIYCIYSTIILTILFAPIFSPHGVGVV